MPVHTIAMIGGALGGLGGLSGLASFFRARSLNRKTDAEAESIEVRTARELIAEVRAEMDRRVSALDQEIGRLRGHLERTREERDRLAATEAALREENGQLRSRIEELERRISTLTSRIAELTAAATPTAPTHVHVDVQPPTPPVVVGRRSTD